MNGSDPRHRAALKIEQSGNMVTAHSCEQNHSSIATVGLPHEKICQGTTGWSESLGRTKFLVFGNDKREILCESAQLRSEALL